MTDSLTARLETLLFIAQKPLSMKKMAELTGTSADDVSRALASLSHDMHERGSGMYVIIHNDSAEFATHPENADLVRAYTREEVTGELTRAGLETLTVIAHRGPVGTLELEQIRGVNCTIVLRNLLMRGFIELSGEEKGERHYTLSFDFLRHLGVNSVKELPDYESLHNDEKLAEILLSRELV